MNSDLIRFIDSISRDKGIDKESVFVDLETAMVSAIRKANEEVEDVVVTIDRGSGEIQATADGIPIEMRTLGRIAAQTAKQVMMQRIREDERDSIFDEYSQKVGKVMTGTVTRYESGGLVVNIGRTEAFMPRSETIPGNHHQPGERIRGMILDVREEQSQVRIVLTQTHPDYIRKLFELEVPEVAERIIEVRALAREAGYRTKIAVSSIDTKVDAVGACVGVRGSRIRNIVDELGGEKIDIVRWNESSQILISNALKPAEVKETFLCFELGRATVVVDDDQLSLAIGKRGQNVRLAARLTGWDLEIMTPVEYNKNVDEMEAALKTIDGVEDVMLDKMMAIGVVSLSDLAEVGTTPLISEIGMTEGMADQVITAAEAEAKRIAALKEKEKEQRAQRVAEGDAEVGAEPGDGKAAGGDGESPGAANDVPPETDAPADAVNAAQSEAAVAPEPPETVNEAGTVDGGPAEVAEPDSPVDDPPIRVEPV